jgi:putative oxidoreductase
LFARILLGLIFLVFGLNGFLQFIPVGTLPPGLAGQFLSVLLQSHYVFFISFLSASGRPAPAREPLRPTGAHSS